ncbi:MAG: hypothetical protein AB1646_10505 [Thermodesulfobacteriota bacterium]
MRMLPVPDIVKEMASQIDDLSVALKSVSSKIDVLHQEFAEMRSREKRLADLSLQMETLGGRVSTLADRVSWLCTSIEK